VALRRCGRAWASRLTPWRSTIHRCTPTSGEQDAGNDEDMQREEAREGCAADDGPPSMQMDQCAADKRNAADDGCADAEAPVGVLIEAQNLAGEGHAQREQKQPTPTIQVSSRGNL
jgi:hypothetical protein